MKNTSNAYSKIIEWIFSKNYREGDTEVHFHRTDISTAAKKLKLSLPKNIGDVIYSFRYRAALPASILSKAPQAGEWVIRPAGPAKYKFVVARFASISPSTHLSKTKIPDSTPGIIESYALSDEQALLAKIRYNRLVDIFMGITCYSLQSHLRTSIPKIGQVETDEIYVGLDKKGVHYVIPVQAKGLRDKLGVVQIEQDFELCAAKFPNLVAKPIGAQFISDNGIALFEFEVNKNGVSIASEKHYTLVDASEVSPDDVERYRNRSE